MSYGLLFKKKRLHRLEYVVEKKVRDQKKRWNQTEDGYPLDLFILAIFLVNLIF